MNLKGLRDGVKTLACSVFLLLPITGLGQADATAQAIASDRARTPVPPINQVATKPELVMQVSHSGGVESVAFSPDNKLLATSGAEGSIKLWETQSRLLRREILTGEGSFFGSAPQVVFTASGQCLITAGRALKFWDVKAGKLLRSIVLSDYVHSLALSPDGMTLALGFYREVQLWRLVTPVDNGYQPAQQRDFDFRPIRSVGNLPHSVSHLSFSRNGLIALGLEGEVRVLNVETGGLVALFDGSTSADDDKDNANLSYKSYNADVAVAFAPDNSLLMSFGDLLVWRGGKKPVLTELETRDLTATTALSFSRDGKKLLLAGFDLHIVNWPSFKLERSLTSDMPEAASASISPDGTLVASGVSFNVFAAQLWNARTGQLLTSWEGRNGGVNDVALSSDNRYLATATDDGPLRVWNLDSNRLTAIGSVDEGLGGVMFSPNNLLVSNNQGEVWDVRTGKLFRRYGRNVFPFAPQSPLEGDKKSASFVGFGGSIENFDVSPDGRLVVGAVSGHNDETLNAVEIWDSNSKKLLRRLPSEKSGVRAVRFMRDGLLLAAGYEDGRIHFWNTHTWLVHRTVSAHGAPINQLRLTADGQYLLSAANDYQVKFWNPKDGALKATLIILPSHREDEFSREWLVYTPEGLYDGSPGADKFMRWRVGEKLLPASSGRKYRRSQLLKTTLLAR